MKKAILLILPLIFIAALCEDNSTEPTSNQTELTITHLGVDWSEGRSGGQGNDLSNADGETIGWCPNGQGTGWQTGIWYRAGSDKIYLMGNGSLDQYKSINESMWDNDVCDTYLKTGDVWASKCNDGYVIFKVKAQPDINDPVWSVHVEYKFSATTNF